MNVRTDAVGDVVALVVSEDADGVNPPAEITVVVRAYGRGRLRLNVIGGDPEREDEDVDKPTLAAGTYHGDDRTFEPEDVGEDDGADELRDVLLVALLGEAERRVGRVHEWRVTFEGAGEVEAKCNGPRGSCWLRADGAGVHLVEGGAE